MSDREMLELAAKAAGIKVWRGSGHQSDMLFRDASRPTGVVTGVEWNPLTDDGDAFRLAAKLWISVSYDRLDQCINERRVFAVHSRGVELEHLGEDGAAATRRAIVRAAAEIGRRMRDE